MKTGSILTRDAAHEWMITKLQLRLALPNSNWAKATVNAELLLIFLLARYSRDFRSPAHREKHTHTHTHTHKLSLSNNATQFQNCFFQRNWSHSSVLQLLQPLQLGINCAAAAAAPYIHEVHNNVK